MTTPSLLKRGAAFAGPAALLLVPKCPLCLLPLLAALGLSAVPGAALGVLAGAVIGGWIVAVVVVSRSPAILAATVTAVGLVVVGRWVGVAPAGAAGLALMFVVAAACLFAGTRPACRPRHPHRHRRPPWP